MLSESSPILLGQKGTCSTAQQHGELSENILQNLFNKLPPQTVRRPRGEHTKANRRRREQGRKENYKKGSWHGMPASIKPSNGNLAHDFFLIVDIDLCHYATFCFLLLQSSGRLLRFWDLGCTLIFEFSVH